MRMGVATIVTRCPGTDGYIEHGRNARLVPPFDAGALAREIRSLWEDRDAREILARQAKADADERFSDEVISEQLRRILAEFC
jgi:glycosyltransferase involved in cell wall biosynthesis